jgi:hypothetical protein
MSYVCTIELPSSILSSTIAGKEFAVDMAKMPNNALVKLLAYGVQRQFNDGCGTKEDSAETKQGVGMARIEAFYRGEIAKRSTGVNAQEAAEIFVAEALLRNKDKAAFKAMSDEDRVAAVESIIEKNSEKPAFIKMVEERLADVERMRAEAAAKKAALAEGSAELDI